MSQVGYNNVSEGDRNFYIFWFLDSSPLNLNSNSKERQKLMEGLYRFFSEDLLYHHSMVDILLEYLYMIFEDNF